MEPALLRAAGGGPRRCAVPVESPAQPHRLSQLVQEDEEGLALGGHPFRLVQPGVEVGDDWKSRRAVERLQHVGRRDLGLRSGIPLIGCGGLRGEGGGLRPQRHRRPERRVARIGGRGPLRRSRRVGGAATDGVGRAALEVRPPTTRLWARLNEGAGVTSQFELSQLALRDRDIELGLHLRYVGQGQRLGEVDIRGNPQAVCLA